MQSKMTIPRGVCTLNDVRMSHVLRTPSVSILRRHTDVTHPKLAKGELRGATGSALEDFRGWLTSYCSEQTKTLQQGTT